MQTNSIMFTIDVETDWCGKETRAIIEILPRLIKLMQNYGVTGTFFVVAELVSLVRDVISPDGPYEVGSHGLTHKTLTKIEWTEVVHEVEKSKEILETAGYQVSGFRAPFFLVPSGFPALLAKTGYRYDASCGSVIPNLNAARKGALMWPTDPPIFRLETSVLKDRLSPFSLTYLRLYHPIGLKLISPNAQLFYFHLHELLTNSSGWSGLPYPLRKLHQRNSGNRAWDILEQLLSMYGSRLISCREYIKRIHKWE
jgi:hypothetical protein